MKLIFSPNFQHWYQNTNFIDNYLIHKYRFPIPDSRFPIPDSLGYSR
ncbi:hypothetical protein [Moorena sp. SIO3B2]|nr:hypothetical protein [Moorena sp. SIO3B2]NEP30515.1 hypothetical protein [Moorena sp. SIO3B2]